MRRVLSPDEPDDVIPLHGDLRHREFFYEYDASGYGGGGGGGGGGRDDDDEHHTFARVNFSNPEVPGSWVQLDALVDTGSTDCELRQSYVKLLKLPAVREEAYETATGKYIKIGKRVCRPFRQNGQDRGICFHTMATQSRVRRG